MRTNLSASLNASGRKRTALTTLKMTVVAPMPRARIMIATAANPGAFRSCRIAYRRSCMSPVIIFFLTFYFLLVSQGHHGIDLGRAAGGKIACQQRNRNQNWQNQSESGNERSLRNLHQALQHTM